MSNPSISLIFDCTTFTEWTQLVPVERMQLQTDALWLKHAADSGFGTMLLLENDAAGSNDNFIVAIDEGNTTRFQVNALGSILHAGQRAAIATKTATYTVTVNDHTLLGDATAGAMDFDLPAAATCVGQIFCFKKIESSGNAVSIDPNGSEQIDNAGAGVAWSLSGENDALQIQSDGTGWKILSHYIA